MAFDVILAPAAVAQLKALKANIRATVRDALDTHLRHEPAKVSKSRIKKLRGLVQPEYRLRVDEIRVFYDVRESVVEVLAIITKAQAETWLREKGVRHEEGSSGEGQG